MSLVPLTHRLRRWLGGPPLTVLYHPDYRLPLTSLQFKTGMDPRRADLVVGFLLDAHVVRSGELVEPRRARYLELARAHTQEYLESVFDGETLAHILALDASELPVDETLRTLRLACGGTLEAARIALDTGRPALNLLGGFHHAGPERGGGFSVFNDVAVAVAGLRAARFSERIIVLDLDAHPPDGIAECLVETQDVWIGSLSGADWGTLERTDETVLPKGCSDPEYLGALRGLLARMPGGGLAFVIAGGDVLAEDPMSGLGLTLAGARQRDLLVATALRTTPSVWLPGGGYTPEAWRLLAGTALSLAFGSAEPVPEGYDPLRARFRAIANEVGPEVLEGDLGLTDADLMTALGQGRPEAGRVLGVYTAEEVEYGLYRYGVLGHLRRLGFDEFRVELGRDARGDRVRLFGTGRYGEQLLIDCLLARDEVAGENVLFVHWLSLQNPAGHFSSAHSRLPGQEAPGLGLAREAGELFAQVARRLGLAGLAFTPAWFHTAHAAKTSMCFVDPARQGEFEALVALLAPLPLADATRAVAEGRVLLDGEPYRWRPGVMVHWLDGRAVDRARVDQARDGAHFALVAR
ncbi:MAG: histone deacetylase [Polyangiaceae bacterium]|nr:histone deacetylase [Polyangiaceae bacterium]